MLWSKTRVPLKTGSMLNKDDARKEKKCSPHDPLFSMQVRRRKADTRTGEELGQRAAIPGFAPCARNVLPKHLFGCCFLANGAARQYRVLCQEHEGREGMQVYVYSLRSKNSKLPSLAEKSSRQRDQRFILRVDNTIPNQMQSCDLDNQSLALILVWRQR